MTLTGSQMNWNVLRKIEAEILIIDEAAEVVENEFVPLLSLGLKHMIFVGDHFQLKPLVNNIYLEKIHNYGFSMFERLFNCENIQTKKLKTQWRMTKELADFVRIFYSELNYVDHRAAKDGVKIIKGTKCDVEFVPHTFQET